jgi:hypothetical protein
MTSKIVPVIRGGALALSVSGMALAQSSNAQNNKPIQPMTDENANSANTTQQPRAAPANRMAPSTTTGSGATSGSRDLGANPKGNAGAERPIKPLTDESKNSADPQR